MNNNYEKVHKEILLSLKNSGEKLINGGIINHKTNLFIEDGIVDPHVWFENSDETKILFLLKEAYGEGSEDLSLIEWLRDDLNEDRVLASRTWRVVSQWVYGILNTTTDHKATLDEYDANDKGGKNKYIRKIAVVNVKKSNGKSESIYKNLKAYTIADKSYLKEQIELINPDVIVSGNIGAYLNIIFGEGTINSSKDKWHHNVIINNKPTIVITAYHPAKRGNDKEEFNNVVNGFQLALKESKFKEQI